MGVTHPQQGLVLLGSCDWARSMGREVEAACQGLNWRAEVSEHRVDLEDGFGPERVEGDSGVARPGA
jgi:hypothetical protein